MNLEVFNANWIAIGNVRDIAMADLMSINDDHETATNGFHFSSFKDQHTCVFGEADANALRVCRDSLCESSEPSSLFKMRVNNNIVDKPKTGSNFHFAL